MYYTRLIDICRYNLNKKNVIVFKSDLSDKSLLNQKFLKTITLTMCVAHTSILD